MTDVSPTASTASWHPLHSLISWPAVIAGAVVAVAVGFMLNLLGAALGASSFDPYGFDAGDMEGFTAFAGFWMLAANAAALFVGAAVASRAAKYADHHKGALHGLSVWALSFVVAIIIGSLGAAGTTAAVLGGEAQDRAETVVVADMPGPARILPDGTTLPDPRGDRLAEEGADTASTLALWGFLTMLAGAVAAVLGGAYGTRGHRWMARAGLDETAPRKV